MITNMAAVRKRVRGGAIPKIGSTAICCALVILATAARPEGRTQRLSLDEARTYLLKLVNQDRERQGLKPVQLDPIATAAGQRHAEEMATYRYLSHWNRDGKLPDHRYTEAGGRDHVAENVYLTMRYRGEEPSIPLRLESEAEFSSSELEDIEEAYFNERPPYDGHRRNILDPRHTHVGLALARATKGELAWVLANTMEFVDRYVELEPIPLRAKAGDHITIKGRTLPGAKFQAISIGRTECPKPLSRDDLLKTKSYHSPEPFMTLSAGSDSFIRTGKVLADGRFETDIPISSDGLTGVYYVMIWVRAVDGKSFLASQRTIVVP